jgi:bifunctional N-acetylglucosamine-1-phosphate-uridyltransferase/glucosamine-1-phosphate-acetyltransferase GlmU-like protein
MQPTLLILAAGMGSRYGSLKQIDRFGPCGETIVEYAIYDALRAGFGKVVMVVRQSFVDEVREIVVNRAIKKTDISFVFQELEDLPPGFTLPPGRVKPWGTGQAVLMAADQINTPFAVVNADDFYGATSYKIMADFLTRPQTGNLEEYCLVDYQLENTLSESGAVSRGVCKVDGNGYLTDITEHTKISRNGNKIMSQIAGRETVYFTGHEIVSMNLMGFMPSMFGHLQQQFIDFLQLHANNNSAEFYIPFAMNEVIRTGKARVRVLSTQERWFGVTYRAEKEMVANNLKDLVQRGIYPADLWA